MARKLLLFRTQVAYQTGQHALVKESAFTLQRHFMQSASLENSGAERGESPLLIHRCVRGHCIFDQSLISLKCLLGIARL